MYVNSILLIIFLNFSCKFLEYNTFILIIYIIYFQIKKENRLYDDRLLIFVLAICAGFNLKQCVKMVTDAYAAVSIVCTDGLKLLMFSKFYKTAKLLIYKEGKFFIDIKYIAVIYIYIYI